MVIYAEEEVKGNPKICKNVFALSSDQKNTAVNLTLRSLKVKTVSNMRVGEKAGRRALRCLDGPPVRW